jgi:hypothetical protein
MDILRILADTKGHIRVLLADWVGSAPLPCIDASPDFIISSE